MSKPVESGKDKNKDAEQDEKEDSSGKQKPEPGKPGGSGSSGNPGTGNSGGSGKTDNTGKPDDSGKPDDKGKPDNSGKPDDKGKPDDRGKPDDSGKPGNSGKPPSGPSGEGVQNLTYEQRLAKCAPDLLPVWYQPAKAETRLDLVLSLKKQPSPEWLAKMKDRLQGKAEFLESGMALAIRGTRSELYEILDESLVAKAAPDRELRPSLELTREAVGAGVSGEFGLTGKGVGIAVIDSGVSGHPELQAAGCRESRVVYSENFAGDDTVHDLYGHGTHVAGVIASRGDCVVKTARAPYRGIAPGAHIVSLRVLDSKGFGRDSSVIAAIERAIELREKYNIRVVNLSLGRPVFERCEDDALCRAVESAWKAGLVVVAAAGNMGRDNSVGNDGYGTILSPANNRFVITVGAMKTMKTLQVSDDAIASYSSKGPTPADHVIKPDLVAPGNLVTSLLSAGSLLDQTKTVPGNGVLESAYRGGTGISPYYINLSGTSVAAPVVSGAAALLLERNPDLTPDEVKAHLMRTARKEFPSFTLAYDASTNSYFRSQYDIFTIGAGYVDIGRALRTEIRRTKASAESPVAVFDEPSGQVLFTVNPESVWANTALWGTAAVWGTALFSTKASPVAGTTALWGTAAVWGTQTVKAHSALWGASALWGNSALWGLSVHAQSLRSKIPTTGE